MSHSSDLEAPIENTDSAVIHCQYYEQLYPDVNDLVVVRINSITDMGIYVSLLEYNELEGMIPITEYTNRRFRSLPSLTRVGRIEFVLVTNVDKIKGYIDLSKKRISPDEVLKAEQRWMKSKCVQSIMSRVSVLSQIPLFDLHQQITWPLYHTYHHAYDAFHLYLSDPLQIPEIQQIPDHLQVILLDQIKRRIQFSVNKVRAYIDITCFGYNGIESIKSALKEALSLSTPKHPIIIKLISSPTYLLMMTVMDKDYGLKTLREALELISKKIKELGGTMTIKSEPHSVSDRDEKEMIKEMEELLKESEEDDHIDLD